MAKYLYPNFPFPFYRNYSRNPNYSHPYSHIRNNNYNKISNLPHGNDALTFSLKGASYSNSDENENSRNFKQKNKSNKNNDDYLFDLFGLKVYSDDVLLISLIYFLYSEGVKDDSLFLVLILLLLS